MFMISVSVDSAILSLEHTKGEASKEKGREGHNY